jgi:sporulation protein YlmC with PRC-barrel domain
MLLKANAVMKSRVDADDGDVGKVVDILFDDERWVARYMVVETGKWLESKRVLVSPASLARVKGEIGVVHADLSREQIRHCPDVDTDQPVSRQYEAAHALHYGHGDYWNGPHLWGRVPNPGLIGAASLPEPASMPAAQREEVDRKLQEAEQSHLRSCKELIGYRVEATDGDAGDIDDLAIDDETWSIPDLIVDTRRWWPGGQVLVPASAVEAIRYGDRCVKLRLSREATRAGPA